MRNLPRLLGRVALVVLPLALGVFILVRAISERELPRLSEEQENTTAVRVITMKPETFVPEISAFGTVEPVSTWRAIAQVSGDVAWVHPDLMAGRLIERGTEIVRIDATDYELAEAQAVARLASSEARLAELEMREENLTATLAIEQQGLDLAEADLERRRTLLQRSTTSQAAVDQAETVLLQQRARARQFENDIKLLPAQRRLQEAERAIAESQLAQAQRNIARTRIAMPFDGRIAEIDIEREQLVTNGQTMLVAEDIAGAEVAARLRIDQLQTLVSGTLDLVSVVDLPTRDLDAVPRSLGLSAELRLPLGAQTVTWPATIRRASFALEPETRTIGLVVGVDDPFRQAIAGERPPLVKGMFVEAIIRGAARENALLVPREALERTSDGEWALHTADADNRLRRHPVTVGGVFGNVALIVSGLAPADRVIVGELAIAIEGMLLDPREDDALRQRLLKAAGGTEP